MVARKTLTGILYVLSTGCRWEDVPPEYGSPPNLLAETHNMGGGRHLRAPLARPAGSALRSRKEWRDKAFLDVSFGPAKKGALASARPEGVIIGDLDYSVRWKVEKTFAWLGNFRRLIVRHER